MLLHATIRATVCLLVAVHIVNGQHLSHAVTTTHQTDISDDSEELFDPSQQPDHSEVLNGLLYTPMQDESAAPETVEMPVTEMVSIETEAPETALYSDSVVDAHNSTIATTTTESVEIEPITTAAISADQLQPIAQPRTQPDKPEAAAEAVEATSATRTSFATSTAESDDSDAWPEHANGSQREAKTIAEPRDDSPVDERQLAPIPYAAELTFHHQAANGFDAEYDEPSTLAVHNGIDYLASSTSTAAQGIDAVVRERDAYPQPTAASATTEIPLGVTSELLGSVPYITVATTTTTTTAAPLPPLTTTTTTTTTSVAPAVTQPPQRIVPKLETTIGVDEILRRHVYESHVRSPLAVLVDATQNVLDKARTLWRSALKPHPNLDVILMSFNMSGIGVTYHFNNTRTLFAGLNSLQPSLDMPGATFLGLVRVTQLIPYDSAIFVCTDRAPYDPSVGNYAAMTLLKKRIRVYLIWFGPPMPAGTTEAGLLGELALKSGGDILRVTEEELGLIQLYEHNDVLEHNGPIETGRTTPLLMKRLRKSYDDTPQRNGELTHAALFQSDFGQRVGKNASSPEENEIDDDNSWTEFNQQRRATKSERLVQDELSDDDDEDNIETLPNDGVPRVNVRFPDIETDDDTEEAAIDAQDTRMNRNTLQAVTVIQMGIQSQLLPTQGATVQVYFEVTNRRDQPTFYNFQVADEQRYLQTLTPLSIWLAPGQTSTAVVTARVPPNAEIGQKDKITFTAQGIAGLATQSAQLTVSGGASAPQQDTRQPTLYWTYGSRCDWKTGPGQCASAVWSLEITAQDADTGLLRVASKPSGLIVRNAFTAGTNGEVKATYSASCCSTKVTISAADLAGNQRTVTLDVRDLVLNEATITAIVVGVLLLLLLVVLCVWLCVWCCRRRRASRDLELFRARSAAQQQQQQQHQAERTNERQS